MECPLCDGDMKRGMHPFSLYDKDFGSFEADICQSCGEAFFINESAHKIEEFAQLLGLWGLERKVSKPKYYETKYISEEKLDVILCPIHQKTLLYAITSTDIYRYIIKEESKKFIGERIHGTVNLPEVTFHA